MAIRGLVIEVGGELASADVELALDELARHAPAMAVALVESVATAPESTARGASAVRLVPAHVGVDIGDTRLLAMAAAGLDCYLRDVVVVTSASSPLRAAADRAGCRVIAVGPDPVGLSLAEPTDRVATSEAIVSALDRLDAADKAAAGGVGVGPHSGPWPADDRFDPALLAAGDRRNVDDRYRYWREQAIVADLDRHRLPLHVAIENWQHDLNIGTIVRNANAFNVAGVHIVGKRRWNRRGAMATDRYLHVHHHDDVAGLVEWATGDALPIVAIDNVAGAQAIEVAALPPRAMLAFGQEGPGVSPELLSAASMTCAITQYGSTRSLNVGVASGIAMHSWVRCHPPAWLRDPPVS